MSGDGRQNAKIQADDGGDEDPQQGEEFSLSDEIGLAGLVDQLRNVFHGAMDGKILELQINAQAEEQPESAKDQPDQQQRVSVHTQEVDRRQVRQLERGLATGGGFLLKHPQRGKRSVHKKSSENHLCGRQRRRRSCQNLG